MSEAKAFTIAEIAERLRTSGARNIEGDLDWTSNEVGEMLLALADEIETANRREINVEFSKHLDVTGELVERLDQVMHRLAYLSGRLDVVGGKEEELVNLMRECSQELKQMAKEHWESAGKPVAIIPCAVQEGNQKSEENQK